MMIQGSGPVDDVGWLAWGGKGSVRFSRNRLYDDKDDDDNGVGFRRL